MRASVFACVLPALAATATAACTDDVLDEPQPPVVTTGAYHHFVQTGWRLPADAAQARDLGFDLDDDRTIDNQAGAVVGALDGLGLDLTGASADAFGSGGLVVLHSVRADRLDDDASVAWRVFDGAPTLDPPRFDGTDRLRVASGDGELLGTIRAGRAAADWGTLTLPVPFFPDQPPLPLPLAAARLAAEVSAAGCTGKLGGVVLVDDLARTLRRLAGQTLTHIARNPEHEFAVAAVQLFDTDGDRQLTVDELVSHGLITTLFAPDVDLDQDGELDGLSFAVGFACVPATFTVVSE